MALIANAVRATPDPDAAEDDDGDDVAMGEPEPNAAGAAAAPQSPQLAFDAERFNEDHGGPEVDYEPDSGMDDGPRWGPITSLITTKRMLGITLWSD